MQPNVPLGRQDLGKCISVTEVNKTSYQMKYIPVNITIHIWKHRMQNGGHFALG